MSENLLVNPDFEGEFSPWMRIGEVRSPAGWVPYWLEGDPPQEQSQGPLARYEMTPMLASQYPYRVHSGAQSVRWFTFYKVHQGGLYQRVPVDVGQWLQFSVWAHAWCSNGDDPRVSDQEMYISLGIDPSGQTDARRRGVVWEPWTYIGAEWVKIQTGPVMARQHLVNVYIETWNKWRSKHADAYVDDCCLEVVDLCEPQPTPEPTPTPTPEPGEPVDYDAIRDIVRGELQAVKWGAVP